MKTLPWLLGGDKKEEAERSSRGSRGGPESDDDYEDTPERNEGGEDEVSFAFHPFGGTEADDVMARVAMRLNGRSTEADDAMELQSQLVEKQGELKRPKAEYEGLQVSVGGSS
ncbi:unnamed protein product [Closterium sp. NIES-65]|nr:unnamed protein product [Closterium sp. NIES-65]